MSAGIVDLGNSLTHVPSICPTAGVGSTPASGVIVGIPGFLRDANNATNLLVTFGPSISGQFRVLVQTSPDTTSGNFTDPTSGLQRMPTVFLSGGMLVVNSGNNLKSGGQAWGAFLRPAEHKYARAIVMSGDQFNAPVFVGFEAASKRTGSGAGFTYSPGSGSVGGF